MSPCCLPFPCLWPKFGILDIVLLWGAEQQPVILQPVNNHGLISLKPLFCLTMKALCYFIVFAQVLGLRTSHFVPEVSGLQAKLPCQLSCNFESTSRKTT